MKKKLIVVNFKMNLSTLAENEYWLENFWRAKKDFYPKNSELVLCPSLVFWDIFQKRIEGENWIKMGAQNCFWEDRGAFTGEVSPMMLKSRQGKYVIVGHSERKSFLGENEGMIGKKIEAILKRGLFPVFCVGETIEERDAMATWQSLRFQIKSGLKNIKKNQVEKIIFCYEPVWAISANHPNQLPSENDVMEARLMFKKIVKELFDEKTAENITVIYGGSVNEKNFEKICLLPGMDGALIAKAGLLVYDLLKIIRQTESCGKICLNK